MKAKINKELRRARKSLKRNTDAESWKDCDYMEGYIKGIEFVQSLLNAKPIQRLTHCPSCDSKENQDYCSFTEKIQCKQCSCVYGAYGGEVYF